MGQPFPDGATLYGSIDCAGPSADGPNRPNALDMYIYIYMSSAFGRFGPSADGPAQFIDL